MAKALDLKLAKVVDFDSLSASEICAELNMSAMLKDIIERLRKDGLLPELKRAKVLRYLRGVKAQSDLARLTTLVSAFTKAE